MHMQPKTQQLDFTIQPTEISDSPLRGSSGLLSFDTPSSLLNLKIQVFSNMKK